MADMEKDPKAKEVFDQEVSADDLNAVRQAAVDCDKRRDFARIETVRRRRQRY